MNLDKLFSMQKKLDERINKEHGLEGQDLLPEKILALQVELGELANEWRGFKFWSKNQSPNTKEELYREYNEEKSTDEYISMKVFYRNPLLEEYVDCLHFILSIGLENDFEVEGLDIEPLKYRNNLVEQFSDLFKVEWDYYKWGDGGYFHEGLELFLGLGEMLGFTWEQIEQAYLEKNAVNHTRQSEGY